MRPSKCVAFRHLLPWSRPASSGRRGVRSDDGACSGSGKRSLARAAWGSESRSERTPCALSGGSPNLRKFGNQRTPIGIASQRHICGRRGQIRGISCRKRASKRHFWLISPRIERLCDTGAAWRSWLGSVRREIVEGRGRAYVEKYVRILRGLGWGWLWSRWSVFEGPCTRVRTRVLAGLAAWL